MNNTYKLQSNKHRFIRFNELKNLYFQESKNLKNLNTIGCFKIFIKEI